MISTLLDFLKQNRRSEFVECLKLVFDDLSEKDKQDLLFEIMNSHYNHCRYNEFIYVFDIIQCERINLNFHVNHKAVTFLAAVISKAPYLKLMDYFIKKGACINFVGDVLYFVPEKNIEFAEMHLDGSRYLTCLDFAESELDNLITKRLEFDFKSSGPKFICEDEEKKSSRMLIDTSEYSKLNAQKEYLKRIILTRRVIDYLKAIGARNFDAQRMKFK